MNIIRQWKKNRILVLELAKNDFSMRYAGSYFGILWAFVQPIVTVLMYVFVFQVAFHANPTNGNYPYVLWLIAGLIPWLFFSESVVNGTNSLLEYSYLVKKVVFPISILPIIKVISSIFVHIFFMGFSFLLYCLMGKMPGVRFVQILYYLVCMLALVVGVSFLTSSIVPFFRDFQSIIVIVMNVGMWFTPILWKIDDIHNTTVQMILKINPMFYIVNGYRESFMNGSWFWQHPAMSALFWAEIIVFYILKSRHFIPRIDS